MACAVLLVLLVCSVIPQAVPAAAHGDFNGDGKISSQDAVWMLRHVLEPQDGAADQASDFNGDGRVDTQDALYLLRYALRPEAYPLVENHDPVELPGKAATCTEPGLMAGMICRVCEKVLQEQTELPALGHSYEQGVCTRCGELKEIVILAEEVIFGGSTIVHDCRNLETVCFSGDPVR